MKLAFLSLLYVLVLQTACEKKVDTQRSPSIASSNNQNTQNVQTQTEGSGNKTSGQQTTGSNPSSSNNSGTSSTYRVDSSNTADDDADGTDQEDDGDDTEDDSDTTTTDPKSSTGNDSEQQPSIPSCYKQSMAFDATAKSCKACDNNWAPIEATGVCGPTQTACELQSKTLVAGECQISPVSCTDQGKEFDDKTKACIETTASCRRKGARLDSLTQACVVDAQSCKEVYGMGFLKDIKNPEIVKCIPNKEFCLKELNFGFNEETFSCRVTQQYCRVIENKPYIDAKGECTDTLKPSIEACKNNNLFYVSAKKTCEKPSEDICKQEQMKFNSTTAQCVDASAIEKCTLEGNKWNTDEDQCLTKEQSQEYSDCQDEILKSWDKDSKSCIEVPLATVDNQTGADIILKFWENDSVPKKIVIGAWGKEKIPARSKIKIRYAETCVEFSSPLVKNKTYTASLTPLGGSCPATYQWGCLKIRGNYEEKLGAHYEGCGDF